MIKTVVMTKLQFLALLCVIVGIGLILCDISFAIQKLSYPHTISAFFGTGLMLVGMAIAVIDLIFD
jgi:hypothetical protein